MRVPRKNHLHFFGILVTKNTTQFRTPPIYTHHFLLALNVENGWVARGCWDYYD